MRNRPSVFEKMKEQLQDRKEDLIDMVPTAEEFTKAKTIARQELQDLITECRRFHSRILMADDDGTNSTPSIPNESDGTATTTTTTERTSTTTRNVRDEIKSYETAFRAASSSHAAEANATIQRHLPPAHELIAYYQSRPEMKELTLEKDLARLQYTLYTHDDQKLTEPEQILEYEREHRNRSQTSDSSTSSSSNKQHEHEVLWRAANQSLFGDVVSCLISETGLIRPQLSSAACVDDCSIVIDLADEAPHLRAECYLNVSIPTGVDGERLSMAGVLVDVYFCPSRSALKARVLHISPSPPLTEDDVQRAAESLMMLL